MTRIIRQTDPGAAEETADFLARGSVVIFPTDTVYGIGCVVSFKKAVGRIFAIKQRPRGKPLPILLADASEIAGLAFLSPAAKKAASEFWPGPITLILKARPGLPATVCRNGRAALRIPDHDFLRNVIRLAGQPITGTSANLSGEEPAAEISQIPEQLRQKVDLVVDGGKSAGKPSVIYDCTGPEPVKIRG